MTCRGISKIHAGLSADSSIKWKMDLKQLHVRAFVVESSYTKIN